MGGRDDESRQNSDFTALFPIQTRRLEALSARLNRLRTLADGLCDELALGQELTLNLKRGVRQSGEAEQVVTRLVIDPKGHSPSDDAVERGATVTTNDGADPRSGVAGAATKFSVRQPGCCDECGENAPEFPLDHPRRLGPSHVQGVSKSGHVDDTAQLLDPS